MSRLLWPDLEPEAVDAGFLADVPLVTSAQVLDALARRYSSESWNGMPGRWAFLREVQASTGSYGDVQRFDAVAIGLVPSVKYARVIVEVKVSRSDWLRELKPRTEATWRGGLRMPQRTADLYAKDEHLREVAGQTGYVFTEYRKWDAALAVSTEFWIAAPPKCVQLDELPPEAGLLEVRPWGSDRELRARAIRQAPVRETPMPDAGFWAAVVRRACDRRLGEPAPTPEPAP